MSLRRRRPVSPVRQVFRVEPLRGRGDPRVPAVRRLLDEQIGEPFRSSSTLGPARTFVAVPVDAPGVAGVVVVRLLQGGPLDDWRRNVAARTGAPVLADPAVRVVALLAQGATAPGWRGRGVATALLATALGWARDAGATAAVAEAWLHDGVTALAVLHRAGFVETARVVGYWDPPPRSGTPPVCRCPGVCVCSAALLVRAL